MFIRKEKWKCLDQTAFDEQLSSLLSGGGADAGI